MLNTSWLRVWWIVYNKQLFGGALPEPSFYLADIKHFGEYHRGAYTLRASLGTTPVAKATLLHEMVHHWQDVNNLPIGHSDVFKEQAGRLEAATGLEIQ